MVRYNRNSNAKKHQSYYNVGKKVNGQVSDVCRILARDGETAKWKYEGMTGQLPDYVKKWSPKRR